MVRVQQWNGSNMTTLICALLLWTFKITSRHDTHVWNNNFHAWNKKVQNCSISKFEINSKHKRIVMNRQPKGIGDLVSDLAKNNCMLFDFRLKNHASIPCRGHWHVRYLHKWAIWPHGLMGQKFWTTIKHKKYYSILWKVLLKIMKMLR